MYIALYGYVLHKAQSRFRLVPPWAWIFNREEVLARLLYNL